VRLYESTRAVVWEGGTGGKLLMIQAKKILIGREYVSASDYERVHGLIIAIPQCSKSLVFRVAMAPLRDRHRKDALVKLFSKKLLNGGVQASSPFSSRQHFDTI
jgi:hypothetical protein